MVRISSHRPGAQVPGGRAGAGTAAAAPPEEAAGTGTGTRNRVRARQRVPAGDQQRSGPGGIGQAADGLIDRGVRERVAARAQVLLEIVEDHQQPQAAQQLTGIHGQLRPIITAGISEQSPAAAGARVSACAGP